MKKLEFKPEDFKDGFDCGYQKCNESASEIAQKIFDKWFEENKCPVKEMDLGIQYYFEWE